MFDVGSSQIPSRVGRLMALMEGGWRCLGQSHQLCVSGVCCGRGNGDAVLCTMCGTSTDVLWCTSGPGIGALIDVVP